MTVVASQIPQAIVFMKVGFHGRETLKEILERKTKEEAEAGVIFWGYGGTLCHPTTQIRPFMSRCIANGLQISIVMTATHSKFEVEPVYAKQFSEDDIVWKPIPQGVRVTCSRYALVLQNLKPCEMELDLSSYVVAVGPSEGRRLSEYIRGHVDKGCGICTTPAPACKPILTVFTAIPVSPYAVFIR
jgi:hypothetical protein